MIRMRLSHASATLSNLKTHLASIVNLFSVRSRIFYVDYPVHSNIGDLLINLGTEQFFGDYRIPIHRRYSVMDMPPLDRLDVDEDTTFLCHGGGNFGDLYPKHQMLRESLLDRFPLARIVFLPQSLFYTSESALQMSLQKIRRHPNCHILVRDRESLVALQSARISCCSLMPDMAHYLWGTLKATQDALPGREMYLLRQDMEARSLTSDEEETCAHHSLDWNKVVSIGHRLLAGSVYWTLRKAADRLPQGLNAPAWYIARNQMIADSVALFSIYERIHTNRLHAMLLALLLGRDVTASDNSYGKLSRYITTWLAQEVQPDI